MSSNRCNSNNMPVVSDLYEALNRSWGWGWAGPRQENKRNREGMKYREDIFCSCLFEKTFADGGKKTIPHHQQVNKRAAVYLCLKDKYPDCGWKGGEEQGGGGGSHSCPTFLPRPPPLLHSSTPTSHLVWILSSGSRQLVGWFEPSQSSWTRRSRTTCARPFGSADRAN